MKRLLACALALVLLRAILPASDGSAAGLFDDVTPGSWYEQAALWAAEKGITSGVGEGLFGPNLVVTRQAVTMLWRIESSPEPSGKAFDVLFFRKSRTRNGSSYRAWRETRSAKKPFCSIREV